MTTIDPEAPCWEEALEGGAYGKQLWREVPLAEWSFWDDAWWWWSPANWSWIRAGGERHVRWWRGTYWVATAWIPPCADPHGTIAPPPDVAPGGGHRTDVATAPLRLTWPPHPIRAPKPAASSTDDDLDEDEPRKVMTYWTWTEPTGRAYWSPPCANPHGTIAPPPDVAPGGGHPIRAPSPAASSTDDDLDEDEPWTEVLTGARRLRELLPPGRAYWS